MTISVEAKRPKVALELVSRSPKQTKRIGSALGKQLKGGEVILLQGDLGSGKTTFTKGLASGMGIKSAVTSPSFTLVHEYDGPVPLFHIDLYRLAQAEDVFTFGFDEYCQQKGVCVVEWPERAEEYAPEEFLLITFTFKSDRQRRLLFSPKGVAYDELVNRFKESPSE